MDIACRSDSKKQFCATNMLQPIAWDSRMTRKGVPVPKTFLWEASLATASVSPLKINFEGQGSTTQKQNDEKDEDPTTTPVVLTSPPRKKQRVDEELLLPTSHDGDNTHCVSS